MVEPLGRCGAAELRPRPCRARLVHGRRPLIRDLLERLEHAGADPTPPLAFLAAQALELPDPELRAARRRAVLVLAAGGDPSRELLPDEPAVASLARDLDSPHRRQALAASLARLEDDAAGLPNVSSALARLVADSELAWHWVACVLLADELDEPGDPSSE